ncbi:MAG: hypothetical protein RLY69_924, partial [Verrucomicrobiota bacterium]
VSGQEIPEETCASMLGELRVICEGMTTHPTFFEIALALAMRWFRECSCEIIVLETGMGGRLDATTAVPADVCVITPIGLDHIEWLGDTLSAIAKEKAGIFMEGKPALSSPQDEEARIVLEKEANEKRAPLEFITEPLEGYGIALAGEHQRWNAALAVAALYCAGLPLNADVLRHGLSSVSWPGRFEKIRPDVILDGAHNPHSAESLVQTWASEFREKKASLIFSAVDAKDIAGVLKILCPLASKIFICPINSPRATQVGDLVACLPPSAPDYETFDDFESAYHAAHRHGGPILIAGSLYLVGEARAFLTKATFQPSSQ